MKFVPTRCFLLDSNIKSSQAAFDILHIRGRSLKMKMRGFRDEMRGRQLQRREQTLSPRCVSEERKRVLREQTSGTTSRRQEREKESRFLSRSPTPLHSDV